MTNNDRTKCVNESCLIKNECLRYTIPAGDRQSYSLLECNNKKEGYFISNENMKKVKR